MSNTFVHSTLATDPDLGDLIDLFVEAMPDKIDSLEAHARNREWQQLTRIAHQLKGAAGSYGFAVMTPVAARLETAAREGCREDEILLSLDELLDLCRRVRSGMPQSDEETCPGMRSESP